MPRQLSREDREFLIEVADLSLFVECAAQDLSEEDEARAKELATQFIEQCGFDLKDSDQSGFEMGEIALKKLAEVFIIIGLDAVEGGMQ